MKIRAAHESDAEATLTFLRQFRGEGLKSILQHNGVPSVESQKEFIRAHSGTEGIMILAMSDGRVVGSLTAEVRPHPQLRHSCEFGMGVLKEKRGRGTGTALISRLADWAQGAGVSRLELCVFARNTNAIRLYERLGFKVEGVKAGALRIDGSLEDIIEMARVSGGSLEPNQGSASRNLRD